MSLTVVFTKSNYVSFYAQDLYKLANFMKITLDTYILDTHYFFFALLYYRKSDSTLIYTYSTSFWQGFVAVFHLQESKNWWNI